MKSKITVIGIGPGHEGDMTSRAIEALRNASVIVGYNYYIPFISHLLKEDAEIVKNGMKQEQKRIEKAVQIAGNGQDVCVISSGDSGIYGMAPLVYEMLKEKSVDAEVEVIPGISAFQKAASLLGAHVGPEYGRYWELYRLKELFLQGRNPETPVGYVRQAGRDEETMKVTTLNDFDPEDVDMFTVVIIGNSQSYQWQDRIITPRGYYRDEAEDDERPGQSIMIESFRTIEKELVNQDISLGYKWPLLHAIHTTADFEMEKILKVDDRAVERIYTALTEGKIRTIITDVTMAASGIRKGAIERLGIEVKCYLNEPATAQLAKEKGITRTQAGIRLAAEEHPDALYVFGNAPTALMELCTLIRHKKANPCGIVAAPVGFVHVCESKHMVKPFVGIPKIIVEGRKGGSNLAATLVNSILCWPDAEQLKPGRDV